MSKNVLRNGKELVTGAVKIGEKKIQDAKAKVVQGSKKAKDGVSKAKKKVETVSGKVIQSSVAKDAARKFNTVEKKFDQAAHNTKDQIAKNVPNKFMRKKNFYEHTTFQVFAICV